MPLLKLMSPSTFCLPSNNSICPLKFCTFFFFSSLTLVFCSLSIMFYSFIHRWMVIAEHRQGISFKPEQNQSLVKTLEHGLNMHELRASISILMEIEIFLDKWLRSIRFESLQGNVWFMELIGATWQEVSPYFDSKFVILNSNAMGGRERTQWLAQLNSNL